MEHAYSTAAAAAAAAAAARLRGEASHKQTKQKHTNKDRNKQEGYWGRSCKVHSHV